ncbi:hypothetical protein GOP47_0010916 [Adiantum capillus-veneris]|uniref:Uncharacterized protein n=1 Tax=Adiantum capillus-veneris TaxID=13818 RepID=A0A9D4UVH1_ADICA|nr:hypothetical protein GOP47_0010916 [Adiantum capillus-veneris]
MAMPSAEPRPQDDDNSAPYSMNGKIIISALGILFCMVFIIVILHLYTKWCWRRRSNMQQHALLRLRSSLSSSSQETYKVSTGLDKEVVEALPIFSYTPQVFRGANSGAAAKATECAVCLAEFRQGHLHEEGSCEEQFHEAQRVRRCVHGGWHHTTCSDNEEQESGDDDSLLNKEVPSQARKWRRSFSDKFPCTAREAVPSSGNAYIASLTGLSQVTTANPRRQDRLVAFSSCSSISSLVSPHQILLHPHVYPPLGESKALTRVNSK